MAIFTIYCGKSGHLSLSAISFYFMNVHHVMHHCTYVSCLGVAEILNIFIEEVMIDLTDNKPAHGHHETVCSG